MHLHWCCLMKVSPGHNACPLRDNSMHVFATGAIVFVDFMASATSLRTHLRGVVLFATILPIRHYTDPPNFPQLDIHKCSLLIDCKCEQVSGVVGDTINVCLGPIRIVLGLLNNLGVLAVASVRHPPRDTFAVARIRG